MQKYWVEALNIDWADEFDVFFFDIYTDTEKNNINWLGEKFPDVRIDYCFGTNESFEDEDGFQFCVEGTEATEEEIATLRKFNVYGRSLLYRYRDWIWDHLDSDTRSKWLETYNSIIDVPEEIFQAYPFELKEYERYYDD